MQRFCFTLPTKCVFVKLADDTVALVNKLLQHYVGTHNFHNFTSGKKFQDASSNRYIVSFEVIFK